MNFGEFKKIILKETANIEYENIVFLSGSEADEVFDVLDDEGEDAALVFLLQQYYTPGEHEIVFEEMAGTLDTVYRKDSFTMSYNKKLNYIGLVARV